MCAEGSAMIRGKSRMRESRSYGSVRGVPGNRHPYRDRLDDRFLNDNGGLEVLYVRNGVIQVAACLGDLSLVDLGIELGQYLARMNSRIEVRKNIFHRA